MGYDFEAKVNAEIDEKWISYIFNPIVGKVQDIPILLIQRGPKNIADVKRTQRGYNACIVLFEERNTLFLKAGELSHTLVLKNNSEYEKIATILRTCDFTNKMLPFTLTRAIKSAIEKISNATADFDNRGLFATHYLQGRLFDDVRHDVISDVDSIKQNIGNAGEILRILGYDAVDPEKTYCNGKVSVILTMQNDFSIQESEAVAPSYTAVSKLQDSPWVILTNGKKWRLYSNRISASSTNYFEIVLDPARDAITKYLVAMFSLQSFEILDGETTIDLFFEEGKKYATALEGDLSGRIMDKDGLFLDIVKGILNHDMKQTFDAQELTDAKETALKIMYRIWFIAYAESRNLLPVNDSKYQPISLQSIRTKLDSFDSNPDEADCWDSILKLFAGIRKGSKTHNLPQYDGNLFKHEVRIESISIRNEFLVSALRGLLENDGDAIDYANLGVRHLGNIFETLMEYGVKQTSADIMLIEDSDGVREVKTRQESMYSYQKNDLYLASKGGIATRKTTASFYTPDEIVKFLVKQGLDKIFAEREKLIKDDLKKYEKTKSEKDLQICTDRILDIQVLDPSMGSGHFLVEALNRITQWATGILDKYSNHPLLQDIESDRKAILAEQKKKGIIIDENLLTHDVLLKRKIMKRCIFGVDVNPVAVDLAKLSLWLDSFAIGVPLTYMDHHIKTGDSTIGMFLDDMKDKEMHSLDDWMISSESNKMICDVISNSDVTVDQVHKSEDNYRKHRESLEHHKRVLDALAASKIDSNLIPKKSKANQFIERFRKRSSIKSDDLKPAWNIVKKLTNEHKFFHWEIEMMDAFTNSRRGFDLIVGNPPWERMKPHIDEFFTPYDLNFKDLENAEEKEKRIKQLFKENPQIGKKYEQYKKNIMEKSTFYNNLDIVRRGDSDLWQIILIRCLSMLSKNGIVSIVIPSQVLTNAGSVAVRKNLLEKDILSMYVFENKKKIFNIHSSYRFVLLSVRNSKGPDEFPAGFYLHELESLMNKDKESKKFGKLSKKKIHELSPDKHTIPEVVTDQLKIVEKISQNNPLCDGIENWDISFSEGFRTGADIMLLFNRDDKGWPVLSGRHIHQFNHDFAPITYSMDSMTGLRKIKNKKIYNGKCKEIHNSFTMNFRKIAVPKNMRSIIASIVPPHTFHTEALRTLILTRNDDIELGDDYNQMISYISGIFNSTTFDFIARSKLQLNVTTIISSLPIHKSDHKDRISKLAAKLVVGTPEFEGFAESLKITNIKATPAERIALAAELDALVALSYNLTKEEYQTVIDSFTAFKKNPELYNLDDIIWDNKNLKEFYGEMAELALQYFEGIKQS